LLECAGPYPVPVTEAMIKTIPLPQGGRTLLLLALFAAVWFGPLDTPRLFEPDEGRYGEIPREMVASGDWVTPRLYAIKYFEKPPLQYWATAAALHAFGDQAWAVRLWPCLTGLLGLAMSYLLACLIYDRGTAWLAAIIQGSALLYFALARFATLDMGLCCMLQLAMSALVLLVHRAPGAAPVGSRAPLLLGLGIALAVLSKGLIGIVIPVAVAALYLLWMRDWRLPWRAQPWWSLLALALIAAPWFVLVSRRNPEFPHFFFIHEHFERCLTRVHERYQPVWFFAPVLAAGFLPWSTLLPDALRAGWQAARSGNRASAMLLAWAVVVFVFFSVSQSKLMPYILPMFPALALLTAHAVAGLAPRRLAVHLAAITALAVAVSGLVLLLRWLPAAAPLTAQVPAASIRAFALAFLLLALGTGAGVWFARRGHRTAACLAAGLGMALLAPPALYAVAQLPRSLALSELEQRSAPWIGRSTTIYCVNNYWQPLPFYWRRTCTLVGWRGELDFGLQQEPQRWVADLPAFAAQWRAQRDAMAILQPQDYRELEALGLPMRVIYTAPSLVAVVR
jgi:4-amino-4-deoxy-L-arabinose transferase-like glycosyltransferase